MRKSHFFPVRAFLLKSGRFPAIVLVSTILLLLTSCGVMDSLRNWGERQRMRRQKDLRESDLRQWETDLKLSRERVEELNEKINEMVQESDRIGQLSWRIGKAYLDAGRFEEAIPHYSAALENSIAKGDRFYGQRISTYDNALPYFNEALKRYKHSPDLLFEAGLAYANASHELGWEANRWHMAIFLFDAMRQTYPSDIRPLFQLALLYGKTTNPELKDVSRAIAYLRESLRIQENDVPARFALAGLLVESGDLTSARNEYVSLVSRIEQMHSAGILKGSKEKNIKYLQAKSNLEKLDACLNGGPCQY